MRFTWGKKEPSKAARRFTDSYIKEYARAIGNKYYDGGADPGRLEDAIQFTVSNHIDEPGTFTLPIEWGRLSHGVNGTFGPTVARFLHDSDKHLVVTITARLVKEDLLEIDVDEISAVDNQMKLLNNSSLNRLLKTASKIEDVLQKLTK